MLKNANDANEMLIKKSSFLFECNICDYNTSSKKDYDKHILTLKHKKGINANDLGFLPKKKSKIFFKCLCGKIYQHQSSYCRHKKTCNNSNSLLICDENETNNGDIKNILMDVLNDNKELRHIIKQQSEQLNKQSQQISELIPRVGNNNNNVINNKNKVDINIFLNEKCKDAISIDDFIKKIEITVSNLLLTKEKGLIEGVSNIFIENMNKLSLYERPIHCTDVKRETLYIKQDEWKKDEQQIIVKDALKQLAFKQARSVSKWKENNPDFLQDDKKKDDFIQITKNVMCDITTEQDKIIKNICKDVHINPNNNDM